MKTLRIRRAVALLHTLLLLLPAGTLLAQGLDTSTILQRIDAAANFDDTDFSAEYTIVSQRPGEERSVTQARLFRRDSSDQFVLLILLPEVQRGQGYLQIDDNVWFYDPEARRFERTSLQENVQDSDAQNADFNQLTYSSDYEVVGYERGTLGRFDTWILDLEASSDDATYASTRIWVSVDNPIVLKEENFSVNGRLMRTLFFPRYVSVGGRFLPSQLLIVDNLNEGEQTQVTLADPSVAAIPDYVFTQAYLERVNN